MVHRLHCEKRCIRGKEPILARILCLTWDFDNFIDDEKDGREIEVGRESIQTQWTWVWANSGRWWRTDAWHAVVQWGHRQTRLSYWTTATNPSSPARYGKSFSLTDKLAICDISEWNLVIYSWKLKLLISDTKCNGLNPDTVLNINMCTNWV